MNLKRYTEKAQEAVLGAQQLAERSHHPQIDPEHVLHVLVGQADGVVPSVLRHLGADPTRLLAEIDAALEARPQLSRASRLDYAPSPVSPKTRRSGSRTISPAPSTCCSP